MIQNMFTSCMTNPEVAPDPCGVLEKALRRCDRRHDSEQGLLLGSKSLERFAGQEDYCNKVFHMGDCHYLGDIGLIFGHVRWLPLAHRGEEIEAGHFPEQQFDLVYVGPHFSEGTNQDAPDSG